MAFAHGCRTGLVALVALWLSMTAGMAAAGPCGAGDDAAARTAGPALPLKVAPGKRYLEDAAGRPFLLSGDTAWSLIAQLTREDADIYLRDRRERGFNTLLVSLLEHRFASKAPANIYGERPFTTDGDYATPNEAYFAHADWVLRRACELGFVVLLTPSYVGSQGGPEGWYGEMKANGPYKLRDYGRFLGQRYRDLKNIVWVQAGDYNPPNKALVRAIAEGIREADPDALQTAHASPENAARDYWEGEDWLAVNNVYTYGSVREAALGEYAASDMPFFLMESAYENEHDAGALRIRVQAYQALLSGAFGQIYGNNPMWHFDGPGLFDAPQGWKAQLASPGARSMTVLHAIMKRFAWWTLAPDGDLIVEGGGRDGFGAASARAEDGSLALIYLPTGRSLRLDLSRLAGPNVTAQWIDPTSGETFAADGSPYAARERTFTRVKSNGAGSNDWLLVLSATATEDAG